MSEFAVAWTEDKATSELWDDQVHCESLITEGEE